MTSLNPDNWASSTPLIVAFFALIGIFVSNGVNLYINILQNRSRIQQRIKNKREKAYTECIEILGSARMSVEQSFSVEDCRYWRNDFIFNQIYNIKEVIPLLAIIEAYASYITTKKRINSARNELLDCLIKIQTAPVVKVSPPGQAPHVIEARLDGGLARAIEGSFLAVMETCSIELVS